MPFQPKQVVRVLQRDDYSGRPPMFVRLTVVVRATAHTVWVLGWGGQQPTHPLPGRWARPPPLGQLLHRPTDMKIKPHRPHNYPPTPWWVLYVGMAIALSLLVCIVRNW